MAQVVACLREWRVIHAFMQKNARFQHAANAAIAVPKGVDDFVVVVGERRADKCRYACRLQCFLPFAERGDAAADVAVVLRRFVGRVADLGHDVFAVVAILAGCVVWVRDVGGDLSVDVLNVGGGKSPICCAAVCLCVFVGGFQVQYSAAVIVRAARWLCQCVGGFFFAQFAAFNGVRTIDAAGNNFFFQTAGNGGNRRGGKTLPGIFDEA